jgi:sporulation protein YlmC with PRC-barrel domain
LDLAAAEAKRGVAVFYTQSFIDKENQRATYQGSVYGAIQEVKMNGDEMTIETLMVDKFSGTVGKAPTGAQQDSYLYSVTFVLTGEIVRSLMLVQARPAPLGAHTNTILCI